jgi:hypothetical protein
VSERSPTRGDSTKTRASKGKHVSVLRWKMAAALVGGVAGLVMLFWALERTTLVALAADVYGTASEPPFITYVMMFLGLILINFAVFYGLTEWSNYLRRNPDTQQLPVWVLFSVSAVSGAALLTGIANHSAFVQSQEEVPMEISQGFIAYQVVTAALVLAPLVLLGVRWSPGYRPRLPAEN